MQTLKEFWPVIAFLLGLLGWLLILTFRLGGIYSWYNDMKENSGKMEAGVEGKKMADKHEASIGDIRRLCGVRGEQLARLEANMEMMLIAQRSLSSAQSDMGNKIDHLANSVLKIAMKNGFDD